MAKNPRSRRWVFTINNPEDNGVPNPMWRELPQGAKYIAWQRERGAQGTEHYQGWVVFTNPKRLSEVQGFFSFAGRRSGGHFEPQKATNDDDARNYVMKEDTRIAGPWELGDKPHQGRSKAATQAREQALKDIRGLRDG